MKSLNHCISTDFTRTEGKAGFLIRVIKTNQKPTKPTCQSLLLTNQTAKDKQKQTKTTYPSTSTPAVNLLIYVSSHFYSYPPSKTDEPKNNPVLQWKSQ